MAQEESFGTFKTTKSVYDRILELKIATPQIIINYGLFLKENNYFEEAFKAYEKGIAMFKWPNVFDIWNTYLVSAFIKLFILRHSPCGKILLGATTLSITTLGIMTLSIMVLLTTLSINDTQH